MKTLLGFAFLLGVQCHAAIGQITLDFLNSSRGPFHVGFRHEIKRDYSRSYKRLYDWDNNILSREVPLSVWYPAKNKSKKKISVGAYLTILKREEEWESLPDERILTWFYYADNEKNQKHLGMKSSAFAKPKPAVGKFPVIIYAPSYEASSAENFILCEFLASHGFIVLASPSRGTQNRFLEGGTTRDVETQARDIEFLIGESASIPNADPDRIGVIGFSFGGISNVLAQMRNQKIKALICLDGTVKYQPNILLSSTYADISRVNVPFLYMSQKDIPMNVMLEDKIDTTLNRNFMIWDSLKQSKAYYLKFHHLTHPYFSSFGLLFHERDARQDKSDQELVTSYGWVCTYSLNFLKAYLNHHPASIHFLERSPTENGIAPELISIARKVPATKLLQFEDFHVSARAQRYRDLETLIGRFYAEQPGFQIQEWKLNNLGLQLVFQGKVDEGINILKLATQLFPASANAFDSLAEAYLVAGNVALAIENFEASLKLDPGNQNAISRIKSFKK